VKEGRVHRMNFLRKSRSGFTFRDMVYAIAAWYVLLMMVYGIEMLRAYMIERRIDAAKASLVQLASEKDKQVGLARDAAKKEGGPAKENLGLILSHRPRWSKIMRELAQVLPADVWLEAIDVTGGEEQWYTFDFKGKTRSQQSLTDFIMALEASGQVMGTALENTTKPAENEKAFQFELKTQPRVRSLVDDG
jgi:hypothetical protein